MPALPGLNAIAPPQLARLIGTPDAPAVLDVRIAADVEQTATGIRQVWFNRCDSCGGEWGFRFSRVHRVNDAEWNADESSRNDETNGGR
jgi:hypothetical protein